MKPAATQLIDILYGDRDEVENFYVGLVPYAATVNIGAEHDRLADRLRRRRLRADHLEGLRRGARLPQRQQRRHRPTRRAGSRSCGRARCASTGATATTAPATRTSRTATTTASTTTATLSARRRQRVGSGRAGVGAEAGQRPLPERAAPAPTSAAPPAITPLITSKSDVLDAIADDGALAPWRHHGQSRPRLGLAGPVAAVARPVGRRYAG